MQTLAQIKTLLDSRALRPKKSLGQNFLIDHNLIRKLADHAGVKPGDLILEVGPGTGALTEELLARVDAGSDGAQSAVGRVVACELDDALAAMLAERAAAGEIPHADRLTVVHADCLAPDRTLNPAVIAALNAHAPAPTAAPTRDRTVHTHFSLVANLPYAAATPLIVTLLLDHPACRRIAVTIQKEVADRLLAHPPYSPPTSPKDYGGLSVIAQALATVTRIATLPRECFWPRPDVTSAMVLLERRGQPLTGDPHALSAFCRVLFAHRRKQLGAVLGRNREWPAPITPEMRPEQLTVEQIETLRTTIEDTQAGKG